MIHRLLVWLIVLLLLGGAFRYVGRTRPVTSAAVPVTVIDAESAWREAVALVERQTLVHGVHGTQRLLSTLHQTPVRIKGWVLTSATCEFQTVSWRCQARYERRDPNARNADLLEASPDSWQLDFASLDLVSAVWSFDGGGQPLTLHETQSVQENEKHLVSSLQGIRAAFTDIKLGKPKHLAVDPPLGLDRAAVPMPVGLRRYLLRPVSIEGPLRSASVLLPYTRAIAWHQVSIFVREQQQPDLTRSRIHISFQGNLYEHESEPKL